MMISTIALDASVERVFLSHPRPGTLEYLQRMYLTNPDLVTTRVRRVCMKKIAEVQKKLSIRKHSVAKSLVAALPLPKDTASVIETFLNEDILFFDESCVDDLTQQAMKLPVPLNGVAVSMISRSLRAIIPSIRPRRRKRDL